VVKVISQQATSPLHMDSFISEMTYFVLSGT